MRFGTQESILKAFTTFMKMGEMEGYKNIEEEIEYKEKLVFATMKSMLMHWEKPSDWASLSPEDKLERLNKAIKAAECLK